MHNLSFLFDHTAGRTMQTAQVTQTTQPQSAGPSQPASESKASQDQRDGGAIQSHVDHSGHQSGPGGGECAYARSGNASTLSISVSHLTPLHPLFRSHGWISSSPEASSRTICVFCVWIRTKQRPRHPRIAQRGRRLRRKGRGSRPWPWWLRRWGFQSIRGLSS